jgi:sugar/nucleoside kinase (ribokinase family)
MEGAKEFDMAFIGHYTKDKIITKAGTRMVDGGAYFYGACAARRMELPTAAVTRLASEDFGSFAPLQALGAMVRAIPSQHSTCLTLDYPTDNPDDRILSVTTQASPFQAKDIEGIKSKVWSVGASIRGEVCLEVVKAIKATGARVGVDAQGYVRIVKDGNLAYQGDWPAKAALLGTCDVFKADVVEAELLTGYRDLKIAAKELLKYGDMELVLTHGDGVVVWAKDRFFEAPFTPKSLIGRSGRGDTCLASYLAARLSMEPEEATYWAAALTSLKMEAVGPFSGSKADVRAALKERYGR